MIVIITNINIVILSIMSTEMSLNKLLKPYYDGACPTTIKTLRVLLEDLMSLARKDMVGLESDNCDRIINIIKSFNVIAKDPGIDNRPVTSKQWLRLRIVMSKALKPDEQSSMPDIPPLKTSIGSYYSSQSSSSSSSSSSSKSKEPTKLYRINMFDLAPEAAQLLMNLLESISVDSMSSTTTAAILDFFTLAGILGETGQDYTDLLEPVNRVLQMRGWTGGGFDAPPNVKSIVQDLNALINTGITLPV